jgi:hypothetical protein
MKLLLIGLLTLGSVSAFAGECRSVVELSKSLEITKLEAVLDNGLYVTGQNEAENLMIQAAFISDSKICYSDSRGIVVSGRFSVKR